MQQIIRGPYVKYFAWRPVRLKSNKWVWMVSIRRQTTLRMQPAIVMGVDRYVSYYTEAESVINHLSEIQRSVS